MFLHFFQIILLGWMEIHRVFHGKHKEVVLNIQTIILVCHFLMKIIILFIKPVTFQCCIICLLLLNGTI